VLLSFYFIAAEMPENTVRETVYVYVSVGLVCLLVTTLCVATCSLALALPVFTGACTHTQQQQVTSWQALRYVAYTVSLTSLMLSDVPQLMMKFCMSAVCAYDLQYRATPC
jgi:hypothetical protein